MNHEGIDSNPLKLTPRQSESTPALGALLTEQGSDAQGGASLSRACASATTA